MKTMRDIMNLVEGAMLDQTEEAYAAQGTADGRAGKEIDWNIFPLSAPRELENAYFAAYKRAIGPMKKAQAYKKNAKVVIEIPASLSAFVPKTIFPDLIEFLGSHDSHDLVSPPSPGEVEPEDVERILEELAHKITGGTIDLVRTISVNDDWLGSLDETTLVGCYWSMNDAFTMSHFDHSTHHVMMFGTAPISSIDWVGTVAVSLNVIEDEIRLKPEAPVVLTHIDMGEGDGPKETVFQGHLQVRA